MIRRTQDQDNHELESILQLLLEQDIDITAREVARRHTEFGSASTITRNSSRRQLVETFQAKQLDMRNWRSRLGKRSKAHAAEVVAAQESKIQNLDQAVKVLTIGHFSLIAAVAQMGGMGKLHKFYENFREVRDQLTRLNAIPADMSGTPTASTPLKPKKSL